MAEVFECLLQVLRQAAGAEYSAAAGHHGGALISSTVTAGGSGEGGV